MLFNNFKLIAQNMTSAFLLLEQQYFPSLTERQCMLGAGVIQCANLLNNNALSESIFDLAFTRAEAGECGLEMYTKSIYSQPWYERDKQTPRETFCNYVLNIECVFLEETARPRMNYCRIVDNVLMQKEKIYQTVEKTLVAGVQKSSFKNKVVLTWVNGVMSLPEYSKWRTFIETYDE